VTTSALAKLRLAGAFVVYRSWQTWATGSVLSNTRRLLHEAQWCLQEGVVAASKTQMKEHIEVKQEIALRRKSALGVKNVALKKLHERQNVRPYSCTGFGLVAVVMRCTLASQLGSRRLEVDQSRKEVMKCRVRNLAQGHPGLTRQQRMDRYSLLHRCIRCARPLVLQTCITFPQTAS
jgi:hypothetical protein